MLLNAPRTASVRGAMRSDLMYLTQEDYEEVLAVHPEYRCGFLIIVVSCFACVAW